MTYLLVPESLRACSTTECLYIYGRDQQYIAATLQIVKPLTVERSFNEDVLSYNKSVGSVEKSLLIERDGSRFVLIKTMNYDINGNLIDVKNELEETKTFVANSYSVTAGSGGASETRGAVDVKVRIVKWSNVIPGTPSERIVRAVLSYAESNYDEIDASSRAVNFIKAN
jgi:hypothetical protein